ANAGAAEQADLTATSVGSDEVNDLDAGDENFAFRVLLDEGRCVLVDFATTIGSDRTSFVDRLAEDVHDAAERSFTDGNRDCGAGVRHFGATDETFGRVHSNGAHGVFAEVLGNFQYQTLTIIGGFKRVQDGGQVIVEHHVNDGANDLRNATGLLLCHLFVLADGLERFRARNDFDEFFGDLGLTLAIIAQLQLSDHVAGVTGRIVHGGHLRTVEGGIVFEQRPQHLNRDIARQQVFDNGLFTRLVFIGHGGRGGFAFTLDPVELGRNDLLGRRHLADHRAEFGKEQRRHVEFAGGEHGQDFLCNLAGLGKADLAHLAEIERIHDQVRILTAQDVMTL